MRGQPKTGQGGYATAVIILVMLAMIIFYMIMVYPSERQKLLRPTVENLTPAFFDDKHIYYIGNGSSSVTFNYNIGDLKVGYPLKSVEVKSDTLYLNANIIKPDLREYSFVPINGTSDFKVVLNVTSIGGTLVVISNGNELTKITKPGVYEIKIKNDSFSIKFSHSGFDFWTTQHAEVKLKVYDEFYDPTNADVKLSIPINDVTGDYVGLKFNSTGTGRIKILLNGRTIFNGVLNNETDLQIPVSELNLKTLNTLEFVASKGSNYQLMGVTFYLFSGRAPTLSKSYFFENPVNSSIKVGINVKILKPGTLSIALLPKGTVYFLGKEDVQSGWNYFVINKSVAEGARGIKVFSIDGRFEIKEFRVELVS